MKYKNGERLKDIRLKNNITMDKTVELFKQHDFYINKSMISRWENGKATPDLKQIVAYAKVFNIDLNYLLGLTDNLIPLDIRKHNKENLLDHIYEYDVEKLLPLSSNEKLKLVELVNKLEKKAEIDFTIDVEKLITYIAYLGIDPYVYITSLRIDLDLSINDIIQDLQREIISLTTKIDDIKEIEEIRDIVQLKYDRMKNE